MSSKSKALAKAHEVGRRTFEASKYAKGSPERTKANTDTRTSEYMRSHRYYSKGENDSLSFRSKGEASNFGKK